eukprot:TRINITY_DN15785_c0_g1_i5.p1 TRINITY_DN15785_c0_g1~~TRINITY_DN15785_c0_g1_i5.p1  ORF type:complete len:422 (-),score=49.58 TRINITY_DN15785_c0_g1_i5:397-1662(-)
MPSLLNEAQQNAALKLHSSIAADRWCVTRADLKELRALVTRAIHDETIVPTLQDPFDPDNGQLGPSIYTVVQQFIVPVTAGAGGMSWALMKNPAGRRCDVFVTHAWTEGIFESIDKVLASMPFSSHNVWCCMLANPQNLDIGGLISDPKASPFALALSVAPMVLVIPNCKESIYRRLWCSYEAYLAYIQNKVILTGRAPVGVHAKRDMCSLLAFYMIGGAIRVMLFVTGVVQKVSLHFWIPTYSTLILCAIVFQPPIALFTSGLGAMEVINLALTLTWLVVFLISEQDRRTFASSTFFKLITLSCTLMTVHFTVILCGGHFTWHDECFDSYDLYRDTYLCVAMALSILLSVLSVGGVASLPCIGRILAQILVTRNWGSEWSKAKRDEYRASHPVSTQDKSPRSTARANRGRSSPVMNEGQV